jgi:predicted lipoprotein with Yx(FWY)xxD motif
VALRAFRPRSALAIVIVIGSCVAAVAVVAPVAARATASVSSTQNSLLGRILVSTSGRTLYHSAADSRNAVRCIGSCAAGWPPLLVAAGTKPVAGPGVRASLLGTVKRPDGTLQVTYDGMPLYLYSGDRKAGSINGQGVAVAPWIGGTWNAVAPSGAVVKKILSASTSSSSGASSAPPERVVPAGAMTCDL